MKREVIRFDICKEANKGVLNYMKEKNKNDQKRFGHIVESNLLSAFDKYQDANYIKVKKTSVEEDYMFGADFWLACKNPKDIKVDNMSAYLDITTKFKKEVQWFGYYNSDIAKQPYIKKAKELPSCFGFLNNGAKIYFGIKRWHNNRFEYKKPVIVIFISTNQIMLDAIEFTSNDIAYIMKNLRRVIYYVSYKMKSKFAGKEVQGYGKRASKLICPSYKYLKQIK